MEGQGAEGCNNGEFQHTNLCSPQRNSTSNNGQREEALVPAGSMAELQTEDNSESLNTQRKEGEIQGSNTGARGGPLFMPGLISPYTSVREFEASVTAQLTSLQKELGDGLPETDNFDISIDDLKIITDEELVDRVFKEAFKGSMQAEKPLGDSPNGLNERMTESLGNAREGHSQSEETGREIVSNSSLSAQNKKRRGRHYDRQTRAAELESDEIVKAEKFAKIKREQEAEKETAQLHSLKSKHIECTYNKSEKMERLKALKFITSKLKTKQVSQSEYEAVRYPEVILCVEFYHNIRKDHKIQEFLVLGRQPLTVLKDKLYCLTDQLMQKAEQQVPSGYFMIENVFYNDLRDRMAVDYSTPIIDWVNYNKDEALEKWKVIVAAGFKKKQRALLQGSLPSDQLPFFKAANMASTCFADLRFRLGVRYLYCHQGDCKHSIVIRDMRLIHPEDNQNKAAYPLLTFQPRVRHRKCSICDIYRAKKVTYDDKWAPTNPSFFCENCYYLLHYSQSGTLMYDDFRVYDYYHE